MKSLCRPHRFTAAFARLFAVAACVLWAPRWADAQDTAAALAGAALPTALLRRVVEVADGQGIGDRVFVIASRTFPHRVTGVFRTREEADARARHLPDLVVVGPLKPRIDEGPLGRFIGGGGCHHDRYSSVMDAMRLPLDTTGATRETIDSAIKDVIGICGLGPLIPARSVQSVTIITRMRDGTSATVTYPADSVDAVFFTLDAMDRFVFQYYARLYGTAFAARMRDAILQRLSRRP